MKQKTKSIVTALLLGVLCAVTLSAVITVPDWETARADLLIGMQYETTGLDLDAVPGWLAALVMLHQNFPLYGWAWGPAAAGLAVLLCWVRGQRQLWIVWPISCASVETLSSVPLKFSRI